MEFSESENETLDEVFSSFKIGGLVLRNRLIRAACFSGMCEDGVPSDQFINFHVDLAKGGVGMTTVSYAAVSFDGRGFENEIYMRQKITPHLKKLTKAVHEHGAAVSIQLNHCGFFSSPRVVGKMPIGASFNLCLFRFSLCRAMKKTDIEKTTNDFVTSALQAKDCGFDAIELHCGHGYLLNQFLSKFTNRRKDEYGGSLNNRMRFPLEVLSGIRKAVGKEFPILVKMNLDDQVICGNRLKDSLIIAQEFEKHGASAIIPSCGFTAGRSCLNMLRGGLPLTDMVETEKSAFWKFFLFNYGGVVVKPKPFNRTFLLKEGSSRLKRALKFIPCIYVGGVTCLDDMATLLREGFPLFQVGRMLVCDKNFPKKLKARQIKKSYCLHCNRCIATAERDCGLRCLAKDDYYRRKDMSPEEKKKDDRIMHKRDHPVSYFNWFLVFLLVGLLLWGFVKLVL